MTSLELLDRPPPCHPDAVDASQNMYEVERLINKIVIRRGFGESVEYLCRFVGWGAEWDEWTNIKNLDCDDLIEEFEETWSKSGN